MAENLYENLKAEYPAIYATIKDFPEDLRAPAFIELVRAFEKSKNGHAATDSNKVLQTAGEILPADATIITSNGSSGDWDYRRELIDFISRDGIDMENINGHERAAVVAYVFRVLAPEVHRNTAITAEILVEACRQARVRLPANPSATLSGSKKVGLLDSAKGSSGYVLSPKGENFVNKLVTGTTEKS